MGIVGLSENNGHPFSFSAIINGYSSNAFKKAGWDLIYDYLRVRDISEYGFPGAMITHAWTQDNKITEKLCEACLIPNMVSEIDDMIGSVDAVIIARDDYENHLKMAMPFLEFGLHVFIDKPLSLKQQELHILRPYLENGRLMSCSGMRYAKELDVLREEIDSYGKIKLIRGAVINSWEKYGVHLLEAVFGLTKARPKEIRSMNCNHTSIAITMDDNSLLHIDALNDVPTTFQIDVWGTKRRNSFELTDNFSMFRRTLWHFINSIHSKTPAIPPRDTLDIMRVLIAGAIAKEEKKRVLMDEMII